MNLAIIPARGGSKRIPRKNIRPFCGKPILAYSIQAALGSGLFDEVMVSTDDPEIAAIAKEYGASVPFFRSAQTANDFATTADVLLEVLEQYRLAGRSFDNLCCLYPTAPLVTADKLRTAFQLLHENQADALVPVVEFSYTPFRGLILQDGRLQMKWPENLSVRSQDLERLYHDSGQFYVVRTEAFLQEKTLFCRDTIPMVLSDLEVQDIDNEVDWELAEIKHELLKKRGLL